MKRTANYEVVIDQYKENRRHRIRGVFVVFVAMLFTASVVFTVAGISASRLHSVEQDARNKSDEMFGMYTDIRYTKIDNAILREYLSEDDVAVINKKFEEDEKYIEEAKKKAEEESDYNSPEGDKIVYLTFDDGPGPDTARLLDVLKENDVKATFFVTCSHADNRDMIKRAYDEGHAIGLHTCSHNYSKIYASEEAFFSDLEEISNVVKNTTGEETRLIRFPGGSSNTVSATYNRGIMSRLADEVQAKGYVYFDWNISSGDAGNANNSGMVYNNIIRSLRGDYSIVLQHDIKGFSVDAVEDVIKFGKRHGFTFKALDADSPTAHHRINN